MDAPPGFCFRLRKCALHRLPPSNHAARHDAVRELFSDHPGLGWRNHPDCPRRHHGLPLLIV
eukprot:6756558-Pyramimonas_sp.AAC.1